MAAIESATGSPYAAVLGIGSYRPSLVVPNAEIVEAIDSSDEWIQQRSGIKQRRFATPEETVQMMSVAASRAALAHAGVDAEQIEAMRKFGWPVFYGDATRLDLMRTAGAATAKILVLAIDDVDQSIEVAKMVRENFPDLTIVARARNVRHYFELHDLGVELIERETLEGDDFEGLFEGIPRPEPKMFGPMRPAKAPAAAAAARTLPGTPGLQGVPGMAFTLDDGE